MTESKGFNPPPYPYDRLDELKPLGAHHDGGIVDCSIGTPMDAPPPGVIAALGNSNALYWNPRISRSGRHLDLTPIGL